MMFRQLSLATAFVVGLTLQASAASLILNGGFETPVVSGGSHFNLPVGSTTITDWIVTQGNVDLTGTCCTPAHSGIQAVDLVGLGLGNGGISQSFTTVIGQEYNLSFWYTHNTGANTATSFSAEALISDGSNMTLYSTTVSQLFSDGLLWVLSSGNFTATTTLTTLTFNNLTGAFNGGIYLDDVSVSAVPISAALPLFATGLAGLGLLGWRRKRKTAAANTA